MSEAATAVDITALAKAIQEAVAEASPVQQLHISRYVAVTPWNPTGSKRRPEMKARFLQNGVQIRDWHITDEDIALLNQIQPGRYVNRKVEVIERSENGGDRTVEIRYNNETPSQRMELKNHWRNFTELLELIVTEAKPAKAAK